MAKEFDRTKPYGTVHSTPEGHDGRVYEQNDTWYDKDGKEWVPPKSKDDLAAEARAEFDNAVNARVLEILAANKAADDQAQKIEAAAQAAADSAAKNSKTK